VLIDPWPEHVDVMRTRGLELYGLSDDERCTVRARAMHLTEVQSLSKQAPIDIAFVSVKSYDTEWATMLIRQYLAPGGYVVSLQNCINEERIAAIVGWGRTVGMIAARLAVDLYKPGHIRRSVPKGGDAHTVFRVGEVHGRITRRVEHLTEMIAAIDSVKVTTNLWDEGWSKLCVNGMRNGVSAATVSVATTWIGSTRCDTSRSGLAARRCASVKPSATRWSISAISTLRTLAVPPKATGAHWKKWKRAFWR
jgi:2-dehydropantoate 2-reductase